MVDTTRPLEGKGRWWRALLFAAVAVVGLAATALLPQPRLVPLALAAALLVAIVAATALPWHRWANGWQAVPALGYLGVAVLLDFASASESSPVFVTAVTVIWLALFHSRRLLAVGLGLLAVALFLPPLLVPESYPVRPWGAVITAYALSVLGGVAGQELVSRNRSVVRAMAQALGRARTDRDLRDAYLATVGALVLVLDRDGRVTLFNRHSEQVTGYSADQIVGAEPSHLFASAQRFWEGLDQVVAGEGPARFEGDLLTTGGEHRRVSWVLTGLCNDDGDVLYVIAVGLDVTEQRQTERLFANVLSAASAQMIFATDTAGVFTAFNPGGERLLGYRAEELIGVATVETMHRPGDLEALVERMGLSSFKELLALATPDMPSMTEEWVLLRKDGTEVPVSMTINTMVGDDGAVLGYVGVAWDITAQREAEAAMAAALERERNAAEHARELDRVKNDFVAMVSHDLRTPLTSIVGNTELLLDGDAGSLSPSQQRLLEAVDRNSRRLDNLVSDLLLLSRIESGTLRMHTRVVSLAEVVDGALEALAGKRSPDVAVSIDLPAEPVLVRGDPDQLERVTINLVGNALKFTPPGGRVEISAIDDAGRAELRVTDTGIGIPEEELPHVFDRFFRSSRSRDRDRPGTGLGLTIARSIIEQHGGGIRAAATPGGGTTFVVDLPRLTHAEVTAKEPA